MPGYTGSESVGETTGVTHSLGTNFSQSTGYSKGEGESEALSPIFEILPTAVEGQEEIMNRAILRLRKLGRGLFILTRPYADPVLTSAQRVDEPEIRPSRIEDFTTAVLAASPFATKRNAVEEPVRPVIDPEDSGGSWFSDHPS